MHTVVSAQDLLHRGARRSISLAAASLLVMASMGTTEAQVFKVHQWTAGWDSFGEPLNFMKSNVAWVVNTKTKTLAVNFLLVAARPSKLYQVGVAIFCTGTIPTTFGQFPTLIGGACISSTRQGVTASNSGAELGVVTTDINGNGSFAVFVGPIASGTYNVEFQARDAAGCGLTGGANGLGTCSVDFQSPGPFGTTTTITIP